MNPDIKVLVVDDDADVLWGTVRLVKSMGYQVFQADSGKSCMDQLKKNLVDLIVLDVMLPDLSGVDLCKALKADPVYKSIFVVLTSGMKISSLDQADGLDFGADGYIARPVSNREFKSRINAMVRILRAERERDDLITNLQDALSQVKLLEGLLPFCTYCKKIRDDKGYWSRIETFIETHSEAELGESICPDCAKTYYPGINIYQDKM
jgi:response regulator RpfG family c-di-GMP phosphodiesterase